MTLPVSKFIINSQQENIQKSVEKINATTAVHWLQRDTELKGMADKV
jgi:hypothetical protein